MSFKREVIDVDEKRMSGKQPVPGGPTTDDPRAEDDSQAR